MFQNHTYRFNNQYMIQGDEGPIGLEGTGAVADIVTIFFDMKFVDRLSQLGLIVYLYKRYIDDGNIAAHRISRNLDFDENLMMMVEVDDSGDDVDDDKRTMTIIRRVADTVIPMLKWEEDVTSNYKSKCLPVLDLEIFKYTKDDKVQIGHQFYQKIMTNKRYISERAAMPHNMKCSILVQEGLRMLLNTSPEHISTKRKELLRLFNMRMKTAGYKENTRISITIKVLDKYKEIEEKDRKKERDIYRDREERLKEKKEKGQEN